MPDPILNVESPFESMSLKPSSARQAAEPFDRVDSDTTVANEAEIREKAPELLKGIFDQVFREINKQARRYQKRIKEMNREHRRYT